MTLLNELIALHAEHGIENLRDSPQFEALCQEHLNDRGFNGTLNKVQEVQRQLELKVEEQGLTHRGQVERALMVMSTVRLDAERAHACEQIVLRRYAPSWGDAYRDYFVNAADKVRHWNHYFLSFTTRNSTGGAILRVNRDLKTLIRARLDRVPTEQERVSRNLLADVLNGMLRDRSLRGFYYVQHRDTKDVVTKLVTEAQRSFAFVQIVQSVMFERERDPNYCLVEYGAAVEDPARALIFVMPEALDQFIAADLVPLPLQDWYQRVRAKDAVVVGQLKRSADVDKALEALKNGVVEQVHLARMQLYANIPV